MTSEPIRALYQALQPAETRVLKLHVCGLSIKEIGSILHISPRTVSVHMHNVRKRMKPLGLRFAPIIVQQESPERDAVVAQMKAETSAVPARG